MDFAAAWLPLQIFPPGGLASSVVTTVWLGVWVVALLNLRLGWVMSGLIVPGYLVPLMLIKPQAALVVLLEGVLTYWLVWLYSEWFAMRVGMARFFGRDRFFALVLISVAVRVVMDGWLLPMFGAWLNRQPGWEFDYQNNLHSFGLIISALVANNFWKTGLRRGALMMCVTIGVTWLLVRFVLLEYSNFSLGSVGFLYEDIASSFLASPKSYIILLITAYLASRMNLHYGWDFSGILIPSLLALQWFEPLKILTSFIEAACILLLAELVLRLPVFQRITIEGARKVLLFFNLSFLYKLALGWAVAWQWPHLQVSDYYGFGYLLPTLVAIKMHDKKIVARMSVAIVQTSLLASLLAAVTGFALTLLPLSGGYTEHSAAISAPARILPLAGDVRQALWQEKQAAYQSLIAEGGAAWRAPDAAHMQAFAQGLRLLQSATANSSDAQLLPAAKHLQQARYTVRRQGAYLLLTEQSPRQYWGAYLLRLDAPGQTMIQVPLTVDEAPALEAGLHLFQLQQARYLAIGGSARQAGADGRANPLQAANTLFQVFHRTLSGNDTLQVRSQASAQAGLWIKGELPQGVQLGLLQHDAPGLPVWWRARPESRINLQRDTMHSGFAELHVSAPHLQRLRERALAAQHPLGALAPLLQVESGLPPELRLPPASAIAASGSNAYRAPGSAELIFLDREVLTPLVQLARSGQPQAADGAFALRLQSVQQAAWSMGYRVRWLQDGAQHYLALQEQAGAARYWGGILLRVQSGQPWRNVLLQAPRPYFEANSLELAAQLFHSLQAGGLIIAGASPLANQDYSADLLLPANKANLMNLLTQVFLREQDKQNWLLLQVRALSAQPGQQLPPADMVLALADGANASAQLSPLAQTVRQVLQQQGRSVHLAGAGAQDLAFTPPASSQNLYLSTRQNKELALLWATPQAGTGLRQREEGDSQHAQMQALGIASRNADLRQLLETMPHASQALPAEFKRQLDAWLQTRDVVRLHQAMRQQPDLRLQYVLDQPSQRAYLLISRQTEAGEAWLALLDVAASDPQRVQIYAPGQSMASQTHRFVTHHNSWWLARSE
ncbi:poly-gamma-glutamate biosynthesis protein PgsC/CapC [Massilia sp. W12]|uniref:poly-gamma-glutamate biosynthesis protein PgsC/CapC n=1 Tax=Massilia sp. W12 TaxID=3126507 RepID=UPI0030D33699